MAYLPNPAAGTAPATRASIIGMIRAARSIPAAASVAERTTIRDAWAAGTGAPISSANPVMVWRSDVGRIEYSHDGTTWGSGGTDTYYTELPATTYTAAALVWTLGIPHAPHARVASVTLGMSAQNTSGAWYAALSDMQSNISNAQRRAFFTSSAGVTSSVCLTLRIPIPAGQGSAARVWLAPAVAGTLTVQGLAGANYVAAEVSPRGITAASIG